MKNIFLSWSTGIAPAHFANIYLNLGDKKWEKLLMQSVKNHNEKDIK